MIEFESQATMLKTSLFTDLEKKASCDQVEKILVGAFIVQNEKLLLIKRAYHEDFFSNFYEIPSGHIEDGESIDEALRREVYEETGLVVLEIISYSNFFDYQSNSGKKSRQYNFLVEVEASEIILNIKEHSEYLWVDLHSKDFQSLQLSKEMRASILKFYPLFVSK